MTTVAQLLHRRRQGHAWPAEQVRQFADGIASGAVSDSQVGAFAMAVGIHGMSAEETAQLTLAMRDSGKCLTWPDLPGPVVDKHSTGGVGDTVSLLLAPLLADCGCFVPMVSGRGLGHTGGTIDKLESIPGFQVSLDGDQIDRLVRDNGAVIVAQTEDIAPADRRLYAVRDVTGTVDSIPLIVASILSKKLAEGLDALVMDIKQGKGAIFADRQHAEDLAKALVDTAEAAGCRCQAPLSDMDAPLSSSIGHALEVLEAIRVLAGEIPRSRLLDVTFDLAARLLTMIGQAPNHDAALEQLGRSLSSGGAAERFQRMVRAQGGPADLLDSPQRHLDAAPEVVTVSSDRAAIVATVDAHQVARLVMELGGARMTEQDRIDFAVGVSDLVQPGDALMRGQTLARIHARRTADLARAEAALRASITLQAAT